MLSLTTACETGQALRDALPSLEPGAVWADLNTESPVLKSELATLAGTRGVLFADVSLLATVPGRGIGTPMEACGQGATRFTKTVRAYGATVEVLAGAPGAAASRKLLRSFFSKGLAASTMEALEGARAHGYEPWLRDHIARELDNFDHSTLARLINGSRRHAPRRAEEMAAAEAQLRDAHVEPRIATATREALQVLAVETVAAAASGGVPPHFPKGTSP